ncbi:hypothetical protein [Streptacidiphilus sp. PAMC 29251]
MDQHPYFLVIGLAILAVAACACIALLILAFYLNEKYRAAAIDRRTAQAAAIRDARFHAQAGEQVAS